MSVLMHFRCFGISVAVLISLLCLVQSSRSQMQQYEGVESSGNIFTGKMDYRENVKKQVSGNQCTFTFVVPDANLQSLGCSNKATGTKTNKTDMHEDIIKLESRMITRDAYTRKELKHLRDEFHRETAKMKSQSTSVIDGGNLQLPEMDSLKDSMSSMGNEIRTLQEMMLELHQKIHQVEEQIKTAHTSTEDEIAEYLHAGSCPPNYEKFNNSCYSYFRDKRTWYKSSDFCQELGGHLVAIETEAEQLFITDFLKDKGAKRDTFWVYAGGNDLDNDRQWTWIGANHIVRHPEFWYSEVTPPPDQGFVCMFLYLWDDSNFAKWTKDKCDFQMPSVCEIPLPDQQ